MAHHRSQQRLRPPTHRADSSSATIASSAPFAISARSPISIERYPKTFHAEMLDVTDTAAIRDVVERSFAQLRRIDVSSATPATVFSVRRRNSPTSRSMTSSPPIWSDRSSSSVPRCRIFAPRAADASSRFLLTAGRSPFPGNSLYHATKWGIEGFVESVAQEVASFGIGMTIVEPGGARTEFRYGSAQVAQSHAHLRRKPGTQLPADARSQKRSSAR